MCTWTPTAARASARAPPAAHPVASVPRERVGRRACRRKSSCCAGHGTWQRGPAGGRRRRAARPSIAVRARVTRAPG
eukprot:scaffold2608_cov362-Prasinococcus_capsulatus_cf.AAC.8